MNPRIRTHFRRYRKKIRDKFEKEAKRVSKLHKIEKLIQRGAYQQVFEKLYADHKEINPAVPDIKNNSVRFHGVVKCHAPDTFDELKTMFDIDVDHLSTDQTVEDKQTSRLLVFFKRYLAKQHRFVNKQHLIRALKGLFFWK